MKLLLLSAAFLMSMGVANANDSQELMAGADELSAVELSQPLTSGDFNMDDSMLLDSVSRGGPGGGGRGGHGGHGGHGGGYRPGHGHGGGHGGGYRPGHGGGYRPGHGHGGWRPHSHWRPGWRWNRSRFPFWWRVGVVFPVFGWIPTTPPGYAQCTAFNNRLQPFTAFAPDVEQAAFSALYECGGPAYEARGCYIPPGYCNIR